MGWDQWDHCNHVLHDDDSMTTNEMQTQSIKPCGQQVSQQKNVEMSKQGPTANIRLSLQYSGAWLEHVQSADTRPHTVLTRLSPMAPIESMRAASLQQQPAPTVSARITGSWL
jgi:hypothetical protein